jgi:hypothetical protein
VEDDQVGDESSYSVSNQSPRRSALSDSEKAKALAHTLASQFQAVGDPSVSAVMYMVGVALRSYFLTPARKPKLTNPDKVQKAIKVLMSARLLAQTVYRKVP